MEAADRQFERRSKKRGSGKEDRCGVGGRSGWGARGGEWSTEEIKRKKKREKQGKTAGDDVPCLCNQQPPIVWRPGATIRAQRCLPFRAATAHQQCLTIMHSLLRRQIIRS